MDMEEEDSGAVEVEDCDDEDDDIYGDLDTDIFGRPPEAKKPKKDDVISSEKFQALLKENHELKLRVKKVEKENSTYSKNISSLYLTARNEVDKKNFIIKNISTKLKAVTQSRSTLSKQEVEDILRNCQEALHESQYATTLDEIRKSLKQIEPTHAEKVGQRKRKRFKFGNMSVYFFKEQGCFEREEKVEFPKTSETQKISQVANSQLTFEQPSKESKLANGDNNRETRSISSSRSHDSSDRTSSVNTCDMERKNESQKQSDHGKREDLPSTSTRRRRYDERHGPEKTNRVSSNEKANSNKRSPVINDRSNNRRNSCETRTRSKDYDSRTINYSSNDRKGRTNEDYRSVKRTSRRLTNESRHHDKNSRQRSRSRSR